MFELIDAFQRKLFSLRSLNVIEIKSMKWNFKKSFFSQVFLSRCDQKFHVMFFCVNFRLVRVISLSLSHRICRSEFLHQNFHNECANQRFFSYVISYSYIRLIKITLGYRFERSCWCFEGYITWAFLQTFRSSDFIAFALHIEIFHSLICTLCI